MLFVGDDESAWDDVTSGGIDKAVSRSIQNRLKALDGFVRASRDAAYTQRKERNSYDTNVVIQGASPLRKVNSSSC